MNERLQPVITWLHERNPDLAAIPPDLDLVENRIVDSLAFMEFILLIEDIIGREISREEIDVDRFRTLNAISVNFLGHNGTDGRAPE
jgi:acyl carrier protein